MSIEGIDVIRAERHTAQHSKVHIEGLLPLTGAMLLLLQLLFRVRVLVIGVMARCWTADVVTVKVDLRKKRGKNESVAVGEKEQRGQKKYQIGRD